MKVARQPPSELHQRLSSGTSNNSSISLHELRQALLSCVSCTSEQRRLTTRHSQQLDADDATAWLLSDHHQGCQWTLQNLPQDIMSCILGYFRHKREALALRQTCRAWLAAFNESISTIAIHSSMPGATATTTTASAYPQLRHLCISHTGAATAKAAVSLLAVPSAASLAVLEISNVGSLAEPPRDLYRLSALRTLSLTCCRLKVLSGCKLHLLPALEALDVSVNALTELPANVCSLGTLRKLNVADNQLSFLPEALGGLTRLTSLRASNNSLVELPDSVVELSGLRTLDLSLNRLRGLPPRLTELTNLQQLGLFASWSHSLRNEGAPSVRVLAQMTLSNPELHLHAEEVLMSLVRLRKKQLRMAEATAAALRDATAFSAAAADGADDADADAASGGAAAAAAAGGGGGDDQAAALMPHDIAPPPHVVPSAASIMDADGYDNDGTDDDDDDDDDDADDADDDMEDGL